MLKMPKGRVQKSVAITAVLASMIALAIYPDPIVWIQDKTGLGGKK